MGCHSSVETFDEFDDLNQENNPEGAPLQTYLYNNTSVPDIGTIRLQHDLRLLNVRNLSYKDITYTGQARNMNGRFIPHGIGEFEQGRFLFIGEMHNGQPYGVGRLCKLNATKTAYNLVYEGEFKQNCIVRGYYYLNHLRIESSFMQLPNYTFRIESACRAYNKDNILVYEVEFQNTAYGKEYDEKTGIMIYAGEYLINYPFTLIRHGAGKTYNPDGSIHQEGIFDNNLLDGIVTEYKNGTIRTRYKKGIFVNVHA